MTLRFTFASCVAIFLIASAPAKAESELTDVCGSAQEWIWGALPFGLLELFCTIDESADPFNIELSNPDETSEAKAHDQKALRSNASDADARQRPVLLPILLPEQPGK